MLSRNFSITLALLVSLCSCGGRVDVDTPCVGDQGGAAGQAGAGGAAGQPVNDAGPDGSPSGGAGGVAGTGGQDAGPPDGFLACAGNLDCPDHYQCLRGHCYRCVYDVCPWQLPTFCRDNTECPARYECETNHLCEPCGEGCNLEDHTGQGGYGGGPAGGAIACADDYGCPDEYQCARNHCYPCWYGVCPWEIPAWCRYNDECPTYYKCADNTCVLCSDHCPGTHNPYLCHANGDCPLDCGPCTAGVCQGDCNHTQP